MSNIGPVMRNNYGFAIEVIKNIKLYSTETCGKASGNGFR